MGETGLNKGLEFDRGDAKVSEVPRLETGSGVNVPCLEIGSGVNVPCLETGLNGSPE